MTAEQELNWKRVRAACLALGEHFDSVQIFVTLDDADGTMTLAEGVGNWCARYGQVKEWTIKQDEAARVEARPAHDDDDAAD